MEHRRQNFKLFSGLNILWTHEHHHHHKPNFVAIYPDAHMRLISIWFFNYLTNCILIFFHLRLFALHRPYTQSVTTDKPVALRFQIELEFENVGFLRWRENYGQDTDRKHWCQRLVNYHNREVPARLPQGPP